MSDADLYVCLQSKFEMLNAYSWTRSHFQTARWIKLVRNFIDRCLWMCAYVVGSVPDNAQLCVIDAQTDCFDAETLLERV